MEKTDKAIVIPIDVGWDDVGSYRSLLNALTRDTSGNHVDGNVTISDVSGSFVISTSRTVAVAGLSEVVVVETPDAVLVMPLDQSQHVRELSERADRV
jgi:mannose-1-phosphate guanylyltransferase